MTAHAEESRSTPAACVASYLPPEWAPQDRVMLTWPRRDGDFAPMFEAVERNFIDIVRAITRFETAHINIAEDATELRRRLLAAGIPDARLRVFNLPNDDVWARDHGPITVLRDGCRVHLDFRFNGWGGKFPAANDDTSTRRLAQLGAWKAPVEPVDFVLEGGAFDVDGTGSLLTTDRCLLAPTRNPQFDRERIETLLAERFGASRILWLQHGALLGDDTDGHVDTLARFCNPHTIAFQTCDDPNDPHHAELGAMAQELAAFTDGFGAPYRLVPLPLPVPVHACDGRRLPAGYANFLIINGAVLVPCYGDREDDVGDNLAQARLRPHFPGRQIIGVDCRALIEQYGSLHCVTMQIPAQARARGPMTPAGEPP